MQIIKFCFYSHFTQRPNLFGIEVVARYRCDFSLIELLSIFPVDEAEGVSKFLNETTVQWKNLALEVRSVRSMLEEVICNWEKYSSTVAALQAWLEDAEQMVNQSENAKRVSAFSNKTREHGDMRGKLELTLHFRMYI